MKKKKIVSFLENDSEKIVEQPQPAVERDQTKHKTGLQNWGGGGGVACRLKFHYFVGCRLKFSIFVGCR